MQAHIIQQLLDINHQFYQNFGDAFAATRRRVQPGIRQVLESIPSFGHWLDLGCGSGALAQLWAQQERTGSYHGVDFSQPLLEEARRTLQDLPLPADLQISFTRANLLDADWVQVLVRPQYNGVLCFAALHHLPGYTTRLQLIRQVRSLLPAGAAFIHSNWQFHNSPKLLARVQPWQQVGLIPEQLEAGDTLLDWRYALPGQAEQVGYRYVHRFSSEELEQLASESGFSIVDSFESDGDGGKLGFYQRWMAV
ncbi:MAG: hypothetical protein CVU39_22375 [Chloroflexi bacterium HGW-Chloroflexi-10]|nr:MAG: hypothetical protein CVU39_22375 [Chloroflexi bacterium HGW-Chloroflexi-10]